MLVLTHTHLSSKDLIMVEQYRLMYLAKKWPMVKLHFDAWQHSHAELYGITLAMFDHLGVMSTLNVSDSQVLDFIVDVSHGYQLVPYHSFYHSADVTAKLFYVLNDLDGQLFLDRLSVAALLVAGLCHDIGHPGLNNLYQKHAQTDLARQYGQDSILEKYSCDETKRLLAKHDLLAHLPHTDASELSPAYGSQEQVVASINEMILMTDMSAHYTVEKQCQQLVRVVNQSLITTSESSSDDELPAAKIRRTLVDEETIEVPTVSATTSKVTVNVEPFSPTLHSPSLSPSPSLENLASTTAELTAEQRQMLCNVILHAVDIFNPVLPWDMCKKWSDVMVEESFRQGDLEKCQGLPITPNSDRQGTDQCEISLFFANYIVKPFFSSLAYLFPSAGFIIESLERNISQWQKLADEHKAQTASATPVTPVSPAPKPRMASPTIVHGRRLSVAAGTVQIAYPGNDIFRRHSSDVPAHRRSLSSAWHQRKLSAHARHRRRALRQLNLLAADASSPLPSIRSERRACDPSLPTPTNLNSPAYSDIGDWTHSPGGYFSMVPESTSCLSCRTPATYTGSDPNTTAAQRQALLQAIGRSRKGSITQDSTPTVARLKTGDMVARKNKRSSSLDASFLLRSPSDDHPFPPTSTPQPCVHGPSEGHVNVL
ncbi:hypothetical protein H4R35_002345 [Dimargaris xerosporica]|nr:hypothetical protein H4R35_002345 [Dimargaris xerosporica]